MRNSFLLCILLLYSIYCYCPVPAYNFAPAPAVEVRAAWLTTNWGLDWPTIGADVETQKEELRKTLDELRQKNFNTILFQARAQGKAFYRSDIEALSPYFNHSENFDPLAFAIEECHKRGMECHAWLMAYPMEKIQFRSNGMPVLDKPDYYKPINDRWYLDPGRPESHDLIVSVVKEIVGNYDVDGIHFDYLRYPAEVQKFPDSDSYQKYGNGKNLYDWRRDNINNLVTDVYDAVKALKKWVQVSSSPLGRYRVLPEISRNDGWTALETVYQDAGAWMRNGKHDLVFPMMYHRNRYFYPYLDDWLVNSNSRIVVPGLGLFQMDEQNWSLQDVLNQINYTRNNNVQGQAYFRAKNILSNLKGIKDVIDVYYATPAKLPPLTWLDKTVPNPPLNLQVQRDNNGYITLTWDAPDDSEKYTYTVYASFTKNIDIDNPNTILETGIRGNSYSFPGVTGNFSVYYYVTASTRYHNESLVCNTTPFSHKETRYLTEK